MQVSISSYFAHYLFTHKSGKSSFEHIKSYRMQVSISSYFVHLFTQKLGKSCFELICGLVYIHMEQNKKLSMR